jgi:arylsulfatase A-like enzyme
MNGVLSSLVDVLPTLLILAGIPRPEGIQGRDLSAQALGRSAEVPDSVYAEGALDEPGEWRAVIRGFDKLLWNLKEEVTGLYNLADDPTEEHDVKDDHDHRLTRDSLWALAKQWMERSEDGRDTHGLRTRRQE